MLLLSVFGLYCCGASPSSWLCEEKLTGQTTTDICRTNKTHIRPSSQLGRRSNGEEKEERAKKVRERARTNYTANLRSDPAEAAATRGSCHFGGCHRGRVGGPLTCGRQRQQPLKDTLHEGKERLSTLHCDTVHRPLGFVTCFLASSFWLVGINTAALQPREGVY